MSETPHQAGLADLRVEVRLLGQFAEIAGTRRLSLALPVGATLGLALRTLERQFGGMSKDSASNPQHAVIFVNGRNAAHDGGAGRALADGDCLVVTSPIGGG